jgi:hypothetical protein
MVHAYEKDPYDFYMELPKNSARSFHSKQSSQVNSGEETKNLEKWKEKLAWHCPFKSMQTHHTANS